MWYQLTQEYIYWCKANNIPYTLSADDLVLDENLTRDQKNWLNNFINRWEHYA